MGISQLSLRPSAGVISRLGAWSARWRRLGGRLPIGPLAFVVSSSLMLVFLSGSFTFFDLNVYRQAAGLMLGDRPLYTATFGHGLGFSYPPITAMLFAPLRLCSLGADECVVTLLNFALLAVLAHATTRLRTTASEDGRRRVSRAPWLAAAVGVWVWPVTSAIGYGQIDLLIAALVLTDLTCGREARWGGLLVGAAAALKLTPLIFIPYLALSRRPWMAVRAAGLFALSIATAFLLSASDARVYWTHRVFDTSHVTGGGHADGHGPANQSLHGALLRLAPQLVHLPAVWLAVCASVAAAGLLVAVSAARRGDEAWGFVVAAVTGLLICPVSWLHHWVIAAPGLLLLATAPESVARRHLGVLLALAGAAGSWAIKPVMAAHPAGNPGIFGSILDDLYVIAGLAILATAGMVELLAHRRRSWLFTPHQATSEDERPRDGTPSRERIRCPEPV